MFRTGVTFLPPLSVIALLAACVVHQTRVEPISADSSTVVRTAVKAHLLDGSTITYPRGVTVENGDLVGAGTRWDLLLREVGPVERIALDSIAGMENYRAGYNVATSIVLTAGAIGLGTLGVPVLAVAIFGSCPTFYLDDAGVPALQAEGFSYSIAPLLESRDVDRLMAVPDADGIIRLEVRNEALETHYVNHLELLEIHHAADEWVVPDQGHRPLMVRHLAEPVAATDRAGRALTPILAASDGVVFETASSTLAAAGTDDLHDYLELVFPAPAGVDSVALVLRLRNSLLTTILLYDVMLSGAGPRALDWLGRDLEQVGTALELGQWYTRQMGLHVQLWRNGRYEPFARISETGPIAWKDMAVTLPLDPEMDSVRVRLRFVADNWRFDRIALATEVRRPETVVLPAGAVTLANGEPQPDALAAISEPDEDYLVTTPGQRYFVTFETTPPADESRSYLLASQGYYTEWMRPDWLRTPGAAQALHPSDELLVEALRRWRTRKPDFEEQFYASTIPVR